MKNIDTRFIQDGIAIYENNDWYVYLKNDENPWIIIVHKSQNSEIFELPSEHQKTLWSMSTELGKYMKEIFHGHKINIGTLGNNVPQLHMHIIVRFKNDRAFPSAMWGTKSPPVDQEILKQRILLIKNKWTL